MSADPLLDYLTAADLALLGFGPADVCRLCPGAVELVALDGSPCWSRADLQPLLSPLEGDELR